MDGTEALMGVTDDAHFDQEIFQSTRFHALTYRRCTFDQPTFNNCEAYVLAFEDCVVRNPVFVDSQWDKVSLSDSTLSSPDATLSADAFSVVKGSTIECDQFVGKWHSHQSIVVFNSKISGHLVDVTFVEDKRQRQLNGTDLSDCDFTNVRLLGIPAERVLLPKSEQDFVIEDWSSKADSLFKGVRVALEEELYSSPRYLAAAFILEAIQRDAANFQPGQPSLRRSADSLGLTAERGARYASELRHQCESEEIHEHIAQFYSPWL